MGEIKVERTGDPELDAMISETAELAKKNIETVIEIEMDEPTFAEEEFTKHESEEALVKDVLEDIEEFETHTVISKPAQTLPEFRDAIMQARFNGLETISASKKVIYHFTKPNYPTNKYFLYEGIRVVEEGKESEVEAYLHKDIHDR